MFVEVDCFIPTASAFPSSSSPSIPTSPGALTGNPDEGAKAAGTGSGDHFSSGTGNKEICRRCGGPSSSNKAVSGNPPLPIAATGWHSGSCPTSQTEVCATENPVHGAGFGWPGRFTARRFGLSFFIPLISLNPHISWQHSQETPTGEQKRPVPEANITKQKFSRPIQGSEGNFPETKWGLLRDSPRGERVDEGHGDEAVEPRRREEREGASRNREEAAGSEKPVKKRSKTTQSRGDHGRIHGEDRESFDSLNPASFRQTQAGPSTTCQVVGAYAAPGPYQASQRKMGASALTVLRSRHSL